MNAATIANLSIDELIIHTQNLIDTGDYGPMLVATLNKLLNVAINELEAEDREKEIERLKRQLDQIEIERLKRQLDQIEALAKDR